MNTHSHTEFAVAGQDAMAVVTPVYYIMDVMQIQRNKLADYRISSADLCNIPCRCCCYQGKSRIELDPASKT